MIRLKTNLQINKKQQGKKKNTFHKQFSFGSMFSCSHITFTARKRLKKKESCISITLLSVWRQQQEIYGPARINSWNLWDPFVFVRISLEFPRIKVKSRLGGRGSKTCNDTPVHHTRSNATMGQIIDFRTQGKCDSKSETHVIM